MNTPALRPHILSASDTPRRASRSHTRLTTWLLLPALIALCWVKTLYAGESDPIIRIEEDWQVEVGTPEPGSDAPQIITVIAPEHTLAGVHAIFELNHSSMPDYGAGGMQLQRWYGETPRTWNNFPNGSLLAADDEVVRYTMSMKLDNGSLVYEVRNGTSTTWGEFGGQGYLKASHPTWRSNLHLYNPETSVTHSRIGFASHRVKRFVRTAVRYYSEDGLETTDNTQRVVHSYSEGY